MEKYPFSYLRGFFAGCIFNFIAFPIYRIFGIKLFPEKYYSN
jgi:hypothetical protein